MQPYHLQAAYQEQVVRDATILPHLFTGFVQYGLQYKSNRQSWLYTVCTSTNNIFAELYFLSPTMTTITAPEHDKKELIISDTVSITSDTTLGASGAIFTPTKTLHINAKGIDASIYIGSTIERTITATNPDGGLVYTSTRAKLMSGSCTLTDADGKALIGTEYFFGPNRDPVLKRLDAGEGLTNEIKTSSRWTSRSHKFLLPDGGEFEWRYEKEMGFGARGAKGTALVLHVGEKRVAALIRNRETRTPGSGSCSSGNGGELLLGDDVGGKFGVEEDLVVATCLLMLKKETDRGY